MTATTILDELARKMGWATTPGGKELAQMEYAITNAGRAATEWAKWWWLRAQGDFPTVAATRNYTLRTVNSNKMPSLWAVTRVYHDEDHVLTPISFTRYNDLYRLSDTSGTPTAYAVTADSPVMYLYPTPSAIDTIYVDYVKYHADIEDSSADALLIVPSQFHYRVYVDGAVFLLNNGIGDPGALRDSPGWVRTMQAMAEMDPESFALDHEEDRHPDARGGMWPNDKPVIYDGYSTIILNF